MSFWNLSYSKNQIAVVDAFSQKNLTYQELRDLVSQFENKLNRFNKKTLGVIFCRNQIDSLVAYLASLRTQHAVFLLDADLHSVLLTPLLTAYQPDWLLVPRDTQHKFSSFKIETEFLNSTWYINNNNSVDKTNIHPDLAVLLSTSGSTGSPKVVRLSYQNLSSNAESIAEYLKLCSLQRPITTLPMHYSYGLSIINSHLFVDATLLLTQDSVSRREFWEFAKKNHVTSLAGVPYIYQVLYRMKFEKIDLPSLQMLTQAGGRLSLHLVNHFSQLAEEKGWAFFVMYGQTEATARISYMPPYRIKEKPESIGQAIPGGQLSLNPKTSELIYQGPNVMMGYAYSREDLDKGDVSNGMLRTGDIAEQDEEGFFRIVGRSNRFIKLFGLRINLEEIEQMLETEYQIVSAALGTDDKLIVYIEETNKCSTTKQTLVLRYKIHPTAVNVHAIENIPRNDRGKPDYSQLNHFIEV